MSKGVCRQNRRAIHDNRGQSLVEFALCSIIFLVTLLGTIDFGRALWQYNMVSDLAQEGARWAAVHGTNGTSPAAATQAQLVSYLQTRDLGFSITVTMT